MSRIRSIHPGLWTDEQFVSLSAYARLLFMGIWNECDDKGTFPWSPLQMKMRVLPADNVDAAELMAELVATDCIRAYEIGGKKFGAVRNFAKFQRPKKPNDIHPATPEILCFAGHSTEECGTETDDLPNQLPTGGEKPPQMEDGGEEIKEEVPPTPRKRGSGERQMIPSDWIAPPVAELSPKARACAEQWTSGSYETHAEAFHQYWRSERKMKADWAGTWANRVIALHSQVMRDQKFGNAPPDPRSGKPADHATQASTLERSAVTYRRLGRDSEAAEMEARARELRNAA